MDPDTVLTLAHDQAIQYPSVEIEHPFGLEYSVYKVRGKMFLMAFDLRGVPSINLKIDPLDGEVLRDAYAEITAGYHMSKKHWITVAGAGGTDEGDGEGLVGNVLDSELLHDLVLESYCLVVAKLPKKERPVDPTTFGGRIDD
ncbi:MAG: MmcQ/YjbR family DNA-binding protein [Brevibacterium sp.]|uniref:MmcQ/YjbR family DNA-binding protein n=1 Tax=Brevibacterium sp. TaxID=1701 RepID=UPI002648C65A|nr:MmcQ/YjbR family DNA-binding protein [Brevibacterium sp.]MDN5833530.1 MmcQ/YjbR family DNA-binding protein [Brevibacterium sp.]MDN6134919.1 MmcQ/YjbR family DNA-binding protein [Brevibacterium sp.]MDN6159012.1 MmcQ/YjbR family DNA-binding protein [Brevibacterium sp.]MDN6176347.1 MmcQ/YjbR family DNA-binding protein [Brevibacterium sp.]MDN6188667.1 MmcQ/YjbR family DNA-binding protein [Brevibacterium sp.]